MDANSPSSNMTEQKNAEPAASRARWRRIARQILRVTILAFLAVLICLTMWSLARSYKTIDRLVGALSSQSNFLVSSNRGELAIVTFYDPELQWEFDSEPTTASWQLYETDMNQTRNKNYYGITKFKTCLITFRLKSDQAQRPKSINAWVWMRSICNNCSGIIVPHWMLLLVLCSFFTFLVLGRRFTLRAFLFWVTIVCVILAIVVRTSADSNQNQDRSVQDGP